ncbi:MAG: trypsin-like peptidase domain-containing protein [Planctomycetota bacterium]
MSRHLSFPACPSFAFCKTWVLLIVALIAFSGQRIQAQPKSTDQRSTYPAHVVLKQQSDNGPHLYFFTNDGCAPCRQVEPAIHALIKEGYPVTILKLNDHVDFAARLEVNRTPTVVMINNNRMVGRWAGLIDGVELKKWFAHVGMPNGKAFAQAAESQGDRTGNNRSQLAQQQRGSRSSAEPINTKVVFDRVVTGLNDTQPTRIPDNFSTPTMHRGVARPGTESERRAMLATVRLKIEDTESISYATGTVIHTKGNESLVLTCGHVFRDSKGQGVITAEYNFYTDPERASGRLIDYDAGPRDIALVAIRTQTPIQPVRLAAAMSNVQPGLDVFSLGCDRGADPTIRRTKIKHRAAYDGSIKYDIFGRPVDGRSGGGLFSTDGQLIGVCNGQSVETDEGIYTALDTIHWELAHTGLDHLFENDRSMLAMTSEDQRRESLPQRYADSSYGDQRIRNVTSPDRQTPPSNPGGNLRERNVASAGMKLLNGPSNQSAAFPKSQTFARNPNVGGRADNSQRQLPRPVPDDGDQEVWIVVRSKSDPNQSQTIRIADPTPELINYLGKMR